MKSKKNIRLVVPNFFTAVNFLLGVCVILLATDAISSPFASKTNLILAAHLVVVCALMDKLDGFAAKVLNASSEFGAQFDSLADLIAFGLAPAFCVIYAYQQFAPQWYADNQAILLVFLSIYVLCAAIRLARYNAVDGDAHPDWFVGLPSTFVGALNALVIILAAQYGLFREGSILLLVPAITLAATAVLMIAPLYLPKLKVRKNKIINTIQLAGVATGYVLGFAMKYSEVILALVTAYAIIGLFLGLFYKRNQHDHDPSNPAHA